MLGADTVERPLTIATFQALLNSKDVSQPDLGFKHHALLDHRLKYTQKRALG
jgi:hypothetical protein